MAPFFPPAAFIFFTRRTPIELLFSRRPRPLRADRSALFSVTGLSAHSSHRTLPDKLLEASPGPPALCDATTTLPAVLPIRERSLVLKSSLPTMLEPSEDGRAGAMLS
jgi:hypothetical protein